MTPGRSSFGTLIGGLSLAAVALAVYLSPVGGVSPHHAAAQSLRRHGIGASERARATSSSKAPAATTVKSADVAKVSPPKVVVRTIVRTIPGRNTTTVVTVPPKAGSATPAPTPGSTSTTTSTTSPPFTSTYTVETKSQLIAPQSDYWGVSLNGVPQGTSQLDALDAAVGRAPSELSWYQGWDEPYPAQTVQTSWDRGALPMITWESKPSNDVTPAQSDPLYSLSDIIRGNYDSYLQTFAQAVAAEGLPVVIRLDQEMNGNWFPWSEGLNGNTPGQFVQMWQHVWNIFQAAGANNDVIWLWAPNRIDSLSHTAPALSEVYPGDSYVNWIGLDAYWRAASEPPTYAAIFGRSIAALESLTNKPIFIAETGGIETDPTTGQNVGAEKVQFTANIFPSIAADPQIVGLSWFDNVATSSSDGTPTTNDWRIDSDPANLFTFKGGLAGGSFINGLMPQSAAVTQIAVAQPG